MKIKVNGEYRAVESATIGALLNELGITAGRVAVELNMKIISRKDYDATALKEGDVVEIVNFVGGGEL